SCVYAFLRCGADVTSFAVPVPGRDALLPITALFRSHGSITGASADINVDATHLAVTTSTDTPTAGVAFNVTVTARDSGNAVVTGSNDSAHVTKTNVSVVSRVPANYTFLGHHAGRKTV